MIEMIDAVKIVEMFKNGRLPSYGDNELFSDALSEYDSSGELQTNDMLWINSQDKQKLNKYDDYSEINQEDEQRIYVAYPVTGKDIVLMLKYSFMINDDVADYISNEFVETKWIVSCWEGVIDKSCYNNYFIEDVFNSKDDANNWIIRVINDWHWELG